MEFQDRSRVENFFHETFRKVLEENYLLVPDAMYEKTKTGTGYDGKTGTGNEESHRYLPDVTGITKISEMSQNTRYGFKKNRLFGKL